MSVIGKTNKNSMKRQQLEVHAGSIMWQVPNKRKWERVRMKEIQITV